MIQRVHECMSGLFHHMLYSRLTLKLVLNCSLLRRPEASVLSHEFQSLTANSTNFLKLNEHKAQRERSRVVTLGSPFSASTETEQIWCHGIIDINTCFYTLNRPQRAAWCSSVGEGQLTIFTWYPSPWGPNYSGLVRQIYAEPNSAELYILIQ